MRATIRIIAGMLAAVPTPPPTRAALRALDVPPEPVMAVKLTLRLNADPAVPSRVHGMNGRMDVIFAPCRRYVKNLGRSEVTTVWTK